MKKQASKKILSYEVWEIMQYFSWLLYFVAFAGYILIHEQVLEGKALVSVSVAGSTITFGYPTLIFVLGYFTHIWSAYIEKNRNSEIPQNTFLPALAMSLSVSLTAFAVVVAVSLVQR
ncbi:MAG: hypothetical protein LAT67_15405 [Balneolales bacterium]|nr:hypothetical protein [Balneolales bacterium]